jgi:hypothetical protein
MTGMLLLIASPRRGSEWDTSRPAQNIFAGLLAGSAPIGARQPSQGTFTQGVNDPRRKGLNAGPRKPHMPIWAIW